MLHRRGEHCDRSAIRPAGLEHVDRPAHAARLEIDQAVDVAAQRVGEKGARADEAELLAFIEQQDDGTLERLIPENGPDFEQRRYADAVVGGSWADRRAVVMGIEQDRLAGLRADNGDDIAHPGAGTPRALYSSLQAS